MDQPHKCGQRPMAALATVPAATASIKAMRKMRPKSIMPFLF